ncbi:WxL protein peptidoglycan domain-containing protein [Oerskovia sp. NPDC060338]|uniref:WxL protein peptidoglycan domain-containing protein n=1 Tax=Oerskovia sp. NPDC060338 TaxID=3347100 RepID=UPI00364E4D6F
MVSKVVQKVSGGVATSAAGRGAGRLRRSVLGLSALLLALAGGISVAHADAKDPGEVRFSVTTATSDGPDKRRIFDFVAEPGEQIQDQVAVSNHGAGPVTFTMVANDGLFTPMGKFDIRTSDQEPQDSGGWFEVQPTVDVPAGETVVVPFTITVPENATPGDHPAGIVATITSASTAAGPGVGVESRVGVRVNLRVPGEVTPSLALTDVRATYEPSWNPFSPGSVRVAYGVTNDGNLRVGADQQAHVTGPFGIGDTTIDRGTEDVEELIPGTSRSTAFAVAGIWPVGPVTTEITVTPVPVGTGGAVDVPVEAPLEPVTVTVTTWAIPWVQILLLAAAAVLVIGLRDNRKRKKQRLEALLAKARAEGRAAAGSADVGKVPSGATAPSAAVPATSSAGTADHGDTSVGPDAPSSGA